MVKFSPILRNLWNKDIQTTLNEGPIILEVKKNDVAFMKNEWLLLTPPPLRMARSFEERIVMRRVRNV